MMSIPAKLFSRLVEASKPRNLYTGEGAQLFGLLASSDEAEFSELATASASLPTGAVVGELASGEGRLLLSLDSDKVGDYHAFDTSPILLQRLRQRTETQGIAASKVKTFCQDLLTWEPEPRSFDFLIFGAGTARLFNHEERLAIFRKARSALKTEGIFYVSTSQPQNNHDSVLSLGQVSLGVKSVTPFFYAGRVESQDSREIGFVVFDVDAEPQPARVYSSLVHNLSGTQLVDELTAAGFKLGINLTREFSGLADSHELLTVITAKAGV